MKWNLVIITALQTVGSAQARLTFTNKTKKTLDITIEQRGTAPDFVDWKAYFPVAPNTASDVFFNVNSYLHKVTVNGKTEASFTIPSMQYAKILNDDAYHLTVPITMKDNQIQLEFPPTLEALIKQLDIRSIVPKSVKEQTIPSIVGEPRVRLDKNLQQLAQEEGKKEGDYVKCPPIKEIREIVADYLINEEE